MKTSRFLLFPAATCAFVLVLANILPAQALQQRQTPSRFDAVTIPDPSATVSPSSVPVEDNQVPEPIRSGWNAFKAAHGDAWDVFIDSRSGAALLVQGQGIPFIPGSGNTIESSTPVTPESLAKLLRDFAAANAALLRVNAAELVLRQNGAAQLTPDLYKVVFEREVAGVPVQGDRYIFYVSHGNLVSFGATRWTAIATDPKPTIPAAEAQLFLYNYLGLTDADAVTLYDSGQLLFAPTAATGTSPKSFDGAVGTGYSVALAWRIVLDVAGEPGHWVGLVDAHTGAVLALYDDVKYAVVKGGVYPISDDGTCPSGCEQPNTPLPFADVMVGYSAAVANSTGTFTCSPDGLTATTTLTGPYVGVSDSCGSISVQVTCNSDLDLGTSSGTDCVVPAGRSAGDTHAARSSFYHLNRAAEHVRWWLPGVYWLRSRLTDNVNIGQTCNAYWDGTAVNFFRSGGGCRNTGELPPVFIHEWGHGLDDNDGGGFDNPYEAYADITAIMMTHTSCMGRGFLQSGNCGGYGNVCLSCTGVRDQDWDKRYKHTPTTPENLNSTSMHCGSTYDGPCGGENHCEAYLPGETMWDLAVRDLPASGIDQTTAWQIVDRLWFISRAYSSGDAYACGSPASTRSCSPNSWFNELRAVDDDDGNLANGTPHAAAIFSAFNRHNIPCGASTDATNRNFTVCPTLAAPTLTATPSRFAVALSWTPVAGAASYNVLRNDQGCGWSFTILANVTGTTYTDSNVTNTVPLYYAIQAVGSNTSCVGTLSSCVSARATGPHALFTGDAPLADTCVSGGAGDGDGAQDAGERTQFSISIKNDGDLPLTGVTVTVTPDTPGVTMINGVVNYADLAVGATATSSAPHFTSQFAPDLACDSTVNYIVTVDSNEGGGWRGTFSRLVGHPTVIAAPVLSEDFSGGIPASWFVYNGGSGGGAAATWTTANPCGRTFSAPLADPVAMVDSDCAGSTATQDEQLITSTVDLTGWTNATLDFDEYFNWSSGGLAEKGDVDVKSSLTSGAWANVVRNQNGSTANPNHRTVDLSAVAAGVSNVLLRFHYYTARAENFWEVDNVVVTGLRPGPCQMHICYGYQTADLAVVMAAGPDPAPTGQNVTYTATVTNSGPDTAYSVQFSGSTPAHTTFQSLTPPAGWTCSAPPVGGTGAITCAASSLPAGVPVDFTIVVRVDWCMGAGTITSAASVSTMSTEPNPANNSSSTSTAVTDNGVCDDGNACTTGDVCAGGVCKGTPGVAPGEADNSVTVVLTTPTTAQINWRLPLLATGVDLLRGLVSGLPVGPGGGDETCLGANLPGLGATDADLPAVGNSFWYLVRAKNGCGSGSYGFRIDGAGGSTERSSTTCP